MHVYHVLSQSPLEFVPPKYHFGLFGHNMKTEVGVIIYMYSKHSPDCIDSEHILVHGFNSLGSIVSSEIPFLASLVLHRKSKSCGQVGTAHVTPRVMLYMHTKF